MGENLTPKLAEWLGLVEGDEFEIDGSIYNPYKYIGGRFVDCAGDRMSQGCWLDDILNGYANLKKLPWKPKFGDTYCFVNASGRIDQTIDQTSFMFASDVANYLMGNCFRTPKEAELHKDEVLQKIKEVLG